VIVHARVTDIWHEGLRESLLLLPVHHGKWYTRAEHKMGALLFRSSIKPVVQEGQEIAIDIKEEN